MTVTILGAGAFGTALAVAFSETMDVKLWGHNPEKIQDVQRNRVNPRLPDITLSDRIHCVDNFQDAISDSDFVLTSVPLQSTQNIVQAASQLLTGQPLICCSKGIDTKTFMGGYSALKSVYLQGPSGIISGPSFAHDIAKGLPSAITIATDEMATAIDWQTRLSTKTLRLYASDDPIGVELGGALKNVIAIACGAAIGAGLGESARAALITRGYAELTRYALYRGTKPQTLTGLSGFGDLCLSCATDQSRNFRFGQFLATGETWDANTTVEGKYTAQAMAQIAKSEGLTMPITQVVSELCNGKISVSDATSRLLSRPLSKEF